MQVLSIIALCVVLSYPVVRLPASWPRKVLFAVVNVAISLWVCVRAGGLSLPQSVAAALAYVGVSLCCLGLARRGARVRTRSGSFIAIGLPIAVLAVSKIAGWPFAIGASYAAFRASALAIEIESGQVPPPDVLEFLAFLFFVPTFFVGPISPYRYHQRSLEHLDRGVTPFGRSLTRIVIGWGKYMYVAELFHQLTFQSLWYDGYRHGAVDFAVAGVCSYLYLYFNFSGFCDVAIGAAGLIGIKVQENFNDPLLAENVPDFWRRWHITLTDFMRVAFFTPFSRWLMRAFGQQRMTAAIGLAILMTFLLIGLWHGVAWNYVAFGLLHGGAITAHLVYTNMLERRTSPEWRRSYRGSRSVVLLSRVGTFAFVSCSFVFLDNDIAHLIKALNAFLKT